MKKIYALLLFIACTTSLSFSQTKTENKTVEKNLNWRTKVGYANLLVDALRTADNMYSDYESMVQDAWDNDTDTNLAAEAEAIQSKLVELSTTVEQTPVYTAGKDFQISILNYLDAMKLKIAAIEKYGILAANINTDVEIVNEASDNFNNVSDEASVKRNIVSKQYKLYARTFTEKDM